MPGGSINIGLIGAGRIGTLHAEHLATRIPEANLLIVADVQAEAARSCAAAYRVPSAVDNYREILDNRDVDAVVICSATDTHARMIEEAAQAGKHIFCEKPIALSLPAIDRALAAVHRAGVLLQIGFNRRFDANFRRVRDAIAQGEIGQPQILHLISRDPAPPSIEYVKVSGGIFLDMTIHDFDMARFLTGSEVDEVYVAAGVMIDPAIGAAGDLDTALIVLKFANGVIGTIDNSRRAVYGYDQRVEVLGSAGTIRTDNCYPNTALISSEQRVSRDLPLHFFIERYRESYVKEMKAFVQAILHNDVPLVTGQDGRAPVVLALAARRSVEKNRPVRVREIGQLESVA